MWFENQHLLLVCIIISFSAFSFSDSKCFRGWVGVLIQVHAIWTHFAVTNYLPSLVW